MKKVPFILLTILAILINACDINETDMQISEVESGRLPDPSTDRKIFISITEPNVGEPVAKVYFDRAFQDTVMITVITPDNSVSDGVGTYFFLAGETAKFRSLEGDLARLCSGESSGTVTENLTLEIDKIYVDGVLSNHPVHIGSASYTLSTHCTNWAGGDDDDDDEDDDDDFIIDDEFPDAIDSDGDGILDYHEAPGCLNDPDC